MGWLGDLLFGNSAQIEEPAARPAPTNWWSDSGRVHDDATDSGNDTLFWL